MKKTTIAIISILLFSFACAPTIKVPIMKPAEINFKGKQRMAIGDFGGNTGRLVSDILTSKIFENGYFQVVDRQNTGLLLSEQELARMGVMDEKKAVNLGKLTGADALVYGNAFSDYYVDIEKDEWKDKKAIHINYKKKALAKLSANFRVVDMTTGKIMAVKMISKEARDETSETDHYPPDPDRHELISKAAGLAVDEFIKTVAPYKEFVTVEFASNDSDIPEIEAGINYCKMGKWNEAIDQFKLATKKNPNDFSSWFNLGIAYEYNYMFREAEDAILQANRIRPDDKCIREISNIRQMAIERKMLEAQ